MIKSYKLLFILSILAINTAFASENLPPIPPKVPEQTSSESGFIKTLKKWFYWDYFVRPYYEKKPDVKVATPEKEVKLPPKIESPKVAEAPSPLPVAAPTPAPLPVAAPTPAPVTAPTAVPAPTPVAAPTPTPVAAPTTAPEPTIKYNAPLQPVSPSYAAAPTPQVAVTQALPQDTQPNASVPPKLPDEFETKPQTPAQPATPPAEVVAQAAPQEKTKPAQPATPVTPSPTTPAAEAIVQSATQEKPAEELKQVALEPEKKPETKVEQPKKPSEAEVLEQADKDILISEKEKTKNAPSLADLEKEANKTPEQKAKEEIEALELASFMKDELIMLEFPRDEIVLGKMTFSAKLATMNDTEYVKIFWENFERKSSAKKSRMIREFINEVSQSPVLLDTEDAKDAALLAISANDIGTLRAVLNHTKTNLLNVNDSDFNLIQASVAIDNYDATYYLIMRGANVNVTNFDANKTLIQIATENNSPSMVWLLKKAGAKDYGW